MEITAAVAADLAELTRALDDPQADVTETVRQLAADVRLAVRSYLGLTITAGGGRSPVGAVRFTAVEQAGADAAVLSSLTLPLLPSGSERAGPPIVATLYAARPGAFVDLAADLASLTGLPLSEFVLDAHLVIPDPGSATGVQPLSDINQAVGILIARGYTPEQAEQELRDRAATAGHGVHDAAAQILGALSADAADAEGPQPHDGDPEG